MAFPYRLASLIARCWRNGVGLGMRNSVMVRIVVIVTMVVTGVYFLYLACFNWWAAGGPPTPDPKIFEARGTAFFGLALLSFVIAVLAFFMRSRT
jgi:hypothetical protein